MHFDDVRYAQPLTDDVEPRVHLAAQVGGDHVDIAIFQPVHSLGSLVRHHSLHALDHVSDDERVGIGIDNLASQLGDVLLPGSGIEYHGDTDGEDGGDAIDVDAEQLRTFVPQSARHNRTHD